MIMGYGGVKIEARGKTDDNGGYAITRYISSALNFWVKEHWDTTLKSQNQESKSRTVDPTVTIR